MQSSSTNNNKEVRGESNTESMAALLELSGLSEVQGVNLCGEILSPARDATTTPVNPWTMRTDSAAHDLTMASVPAGSAPVAARTINQVMPACSTVAHAGAAPLSVEHIAAISTAVIPAVINQICGHLKEAPEQMQQLLHGSSAHLPVQIK